MVRPSADFPITPLSVTHFADFIKARERHRKAKEAGSWRGVGKKDEIIERFRFCNVRRNDDRVTKWIHTKWLHPNKGDKHLWFAMVVARLFNSPETLEAIGYPVPWDAEKVRGILQGRKLEHRKVFNPAYIVSTNGRAMDKVDYVVDLVLSPMWAARAGILASLNKTNALDDVHRLLMGQQGLGSFMAAQVVADLKYADPSHWEDFDTFAASGPGSKRGMARVLRLPAKTAIAETPFRELLIKLRHAINAKLKWEEPITAQDIQNCLCEYDKYLRALTGEGRPKQLYTPHGEE